jgi:protein TonB
MLHQTKWIGLSLALHLTVVSGLTVMTARNAVHTPKTIMVILDRLDSPELSQVQTRQSPVRAITRPAVQDHQAVPASKSETVPSEPVPHTLQPVAPTSTITSRSPEQIQARVVAQSSPEHTPAVSNRPAPVGSNPQTVQATSPEGRPTAEKTQQRYLKEHFIYIRDMITQQLVYPQMARKMGWSGRTVVTFVIAEDGTVHNIRIVESSGFSLLDKSAAETVRAAAPFPKPPLRADIVIPINFKIMP